VKFKEFYDEVYFTTLYFYWGCTRDEVKRHIDRKLNIDLKSDFDDLFHAESWVFTLDRHNYYVVWVENKKNFYGLVHEITHTIFKVFNDRGIPICYENQETFAYYHEYWLRRLWKEMSKKK
jgi:uncharacterized membrane protein